jgi:hypothetical protein
MASRARGFHKCRRNHNAVKSFQTCNGRQPPFKERIMNKIVSGLLAATLSVSFAATAAVPAGAAQIFLPQAPYVSSDVQAVDYKPWKKNPNVNRNRNFRALFGL